MKESYYRILVALVVLVSMALVVYSHILSEQINPAIIEEWQAINR